MKDKYLSIAEAAKYLGMNRESVYAGISLGRIPAKRREYGKHLSERLTILVSDLDEYKRTKYCRTQSLKEDGTLMYDNSKGEYSVPQLAKVVGVHKNRIYYLIYAGSLPFTKVGSSYVMKLTDYHEMKATLEKRKKVIH